VTTAANLFQRLQAALPLERPAWEGSGRQAGVLVALYQKLLAQLQRLERAMEDGMDGEEAGLDKVQLVERGEGLALWRLTVMEYGPN